MNRQEAGVSEIVGTLAIIGVMVAGILIVNMVIVSQPRPGRMPALEALVTNSSTFVAMTHQGGDTLYAGQYRILVDGEDRTSAFNNSGGLSYSDLNWSIGQTLYLDLPSVPGEVVVVYTGGGTGEYQLISTHLPRGVVVPPYFNESTPTPLPPATPPSPPPTSPAPTPTPSPPWYNCDWPYRKNITIDKAKVVGSPSKDFPVYINITRDSDLSNYAMSNGYDIFFTDTVSQASIPYERVSYFKGNFSGWVQVQGLSSAANTTIFMYFGNPSTFDQSYKEGVWNSSYKGVWHLEEEATGTGTLDLYTDSTSNSYHGDDYISQAERGGKLDYGKRFDGSDDYITMGSGCLVSSAWTLETWIHPRSPPNYNRIFMQGDSACSNPHIMLTWCDSKVEATRTTGADTSSPQKASGSITDNSWSHVVWTFNGATDTIYVNGAPSSGTTSGASYGLGGYLYVGRRDSGNYWTGNMDEIRLSSIAQNADWIATEYNNQYSPSTFAYVNTTEYLVC